MSDRYVEKSFLVLLVVSLLLHAAVGALLYYLPNPERPKPQDTVILDLKDLTIPVKPPAEIPIKIPEPVIQKEKSPKAELDKQVLRRDSTVEKKNYYIPKGVQTHDEFGKNKQPAPALPTPTERRQKQIEHEESVSGLLKPKKQQSPDRLDDLSLRPNMSKSIENRLNNLDGDSGKFGVVDGTEISLESYTRRFLNEINSHLVYPPQAKQMGLEGRGNFEVTINRKGEIVSLRITNSGGKVFDDVTFETFKKAVLGPLPRAYKEEFVTYRLNYVFRLPPKQSR